MNETIAINRCKNCGSESADIYVNGIRHIVHCEAVGCGAPDLLEVCKEYVSLMAYTEPMDVDSWKAWRNAIARA